MLGRDCGVGINAESEPKELTTLHAFIRDISGMGSNVTAGRLPRRAVAGS